MAVAPYFAPAYFPPSFFYGSIAGDTIATVGPYYAPTYFPPSYFYEGVSSSTTPPGESTVGPYYAPTYFPPSFFYESGGPSTIPPGSATVGPYYAPTYFPPSFFYESGALFSPTPTPTPPATNSIEAMGRDQPGYAALMCLIRELGVFEAVIFGAAIQRNQAGADSYPLAVLTPKGWEESDDYDPILILRRVTFGITIVVQSQDGLPQYGQLDRLSSAILHTVDFSELADCCVAPLTRIRAGRYESSTHYPEQSLELDGEFSLLIDPQSLVSAIT